MKNKIIYLLSILPIVCLTSCRVTLIKSKTVESSVYALFDGKVDSGRKIKYEVLEDKELLPYFSIDSYLSLYNNYLIDGYKITTSNSRNGSTVFVTNKEDQNLFVMAIDATTKTIIENGEFSSAFNIAKDYSLSSLSLRSVNNYETAYEPISIREFTYRNMDFKTFSKNGTVYYPLSLLECVFSSYSGIRHLFNYSRIIQYADYEELTDTTYKVGGNDVTAFKEMKEYINTSLKEMPLYPREDRRASFLFTLENVYGLKFTRNISSMREYLEKQDFYNDFLSASALKRNEAFYKTFALLDDGHSSIRNHADFPYEEGVFNQYGPKVSRILSVRQTLSNQRTLAPGEVYYSTDEKLAFFTFDSFTFAENAYKEDKRTLKDDLSDYHSVNYDTFFYFVKLLNEIKNKGGVKDVVIDISTNGGGTVGIMMKLITLLAKTNNSAIYLRTDVTGMVQKMTTKVDSNGDGVYGDNDVFGNDFKIHILTSEFSFSCGNAFPFFLKKNRIATIIGVKSGGGECAVGEAYLPSGEHYCHSSDLHIGWYECDKFEGDEPGVEVDVSIDYADFYNLDKLQTLIK